MPSVPVFISYARQTSAEHAQAIRRALAALEIEAVLDTEQIPYGAPFPQRIKEGLLGARVFVAVIDATYFRRPYCAREWEAAMVPHRPGDPAPDWFLPVLGDDAGTATLQRLPPSLSTVNLPRASAPGAAAALVAERLGGADLTLADRLGGAGLRSRFDDAIDGEPPLPPPLSLAGIDPLHLGAAGPSLRSRFVGRTEDLWRLNNMLDPIGEEVGHVAALTGALQGGGGFGKTQLAREYLWRFGPLTFTEGLFWIDAAESAGDGPTALEDALQPQWHEMLCAIRGRDAVPPLEEMAQQQEVGAALADALKDVAARGPTLVVIDNVPEMGARSANDHCPGAEHVTVLATSRRRLPDVPGIDVDVLEIGPALRLLRDGLETDHLEQEQWEAIARWAGRLPLVIDLLNKALRFGHGQQALWRAATDADPVEVAEEIHQALDGQVPADAVRSVAAAFDVSYACLPESAQEAARVLAQFAPAEIPQALIDAVLAQRGAMEVRTLLIGHSLLQAAGDVGNESVSMHRVLAAHLRGRASADGSELKAAALAIGSVITEDACSEPARRPEMLRHLDAALAVVERASGSGAEMARGLFELGVGLQALGSHSGLRRPTEIAVSAYRVPLTDSRELAPLSWAMTQNNLGNALQELGRQQAGTARLEEAVSAYALALEEWTRDRVPRDWAIAQNNLGNALTELGRRETGTERLEEAVEAFTLALEERTRGRVPLDWAITQNNLGTVLQELGQREEGTGRLQEAVDAYGLALGELVRERVPLDWAITQNNLGSVLCEIGRRETGTERLEEAVKAYGLALEERTREQVPLQWAMTQNDLGNALTELGRREAGTARLEEAVKAYGLALEERTQDRVPLQWALTQHNLGGALQHLGEREAGTERLKEAVKAHDLALLERTREDLPLDWAMTQNNLGSVLEELGRREAGTERLDEAAESFRRALAVFREADAPAFVAIAARNLSRAERLLAERGGETGGR